MKTLHKALRNDLGQGMDLQPRRKEWLPYALAAAGFASSVLGGVQASKAAKEAEKRQRAQEASDNAYFTRRYNESVLDTNVGQRLLERANQIVDKWRKQAKGARIVAGGTEASEAMQKEAGNEMMGKTIADIAAQDSAQKANIDVQRQASQQRYMQMDMNREQARANAITQASQGASNAMMTAAGALAQDNAGADLTGGSNNSTVKTTTSADDPRWNGVHITDADKAEILGNGWARDHGIATYDYRP